MTARLLSLVLTAGVVASSDLGAQVARARLVSSTPATAPAKTVWRGSAWRIVPGAETGQWVFMTAISEKGRTRVSLELSEYGNHGVVLWRVAEGACGASSKVVVAKRAATRASTPIFSAGGPDVPATIVSQANAPSLDTTKSYSFAVSWGRTRAAKDSLRANWSADICAALELETPARAARETGSVRP